MNKDLMELLDEIAKTTFEIHSIYNKLSFALQKQKDLENLISSLIIKKIEEDDLYSYLEDAPIDLLNVYNYLYKREKESYKLMNETSRLCYRRILNNLYIIILIDEDIFNLIGHELLKNDRNYQFLLDNNINKEEAVYFYRKFKYNFELSLSYRFDTILNNEITNNKDNKELIKIRLNTAFVRGNELEDELITSKFTNINSTLLEETSPTFGISINIKDDFQNINALLSIHLNISKLSKMSPNNTTKELIYEFKTFILYLSENNLQILKNNIINTTFISPLIKKELLKSIDNLKDDIKIHNNTKRKQL